MWIKSIHDDREAMRAIDIAREHFDNVNLDLMYALPGQTLDEARADVEAAIDAGVAHLSFYHLTIEPNTHFYRHPPALPDDDTSAAMQDLIGAALARRGYVHYETSAWARPGRECRHNLNYWRFGDYLGIGAGAHSKLSFPGRITRAARWKQPKEYLERVREGWPAQESHEVGRDDLVFEFMINTLRLTEGFPVSLLAERTGLQIALAEEALREAEARGLIVRDHERIAPSALGQCPPPDLCKRRIFDLSLIADDAVPAVGWELRASRLGCFQDADGRDRPGLPGRGRAAGRPGGDARGGL